MHFSIDILEFPGTEPGLYVDGSCCARFEREKQREGYENCPHVQRAISGGMLNRNRHFLHARSEILWTLGSMGTTKATWMEGKLQNGSGNRHGHAST